MFNLPGRIAYSRNLKSLTKNFRSICSDQPQQIQATQSFSDSNSSGIDEKKEYGEREIFLLNPTDARTPLPGNTGVVPMTVQFQDASKPVSAKHDVMCSSMFSQTPEERQKFAWTQLAVAAVEYALSSALECTVHECPQLLKKDFADLFPKINMKNDRLIVMTLCQRTENDMKLWNEKVEEERRSLERSFLITAKAICSTLREFGYWANYIHPTSGKPAFGLNSTKGTMYETDLRYKYFGFTIEDLGCCKVLSHRLWGTHAFVGAIFTNAPSDSNQIRAIMKAHAALR